MAEFVGHRLDSSTLPTPEVPFAEEIVSQIQVDLSNTWI
jgi:hypothetical protein